MKSTFRKRDNLKTPFVQINSCKCIGCWECINICPNNVIDKSFLFIANTLINEQVLISMPVNVQVVLNVYMLVQTMQ